MTDPGFLFGAKSKDAEVSAYNSMQEIMGVLELISSAAAPSHLVIEKKPALLMAWLLELGSAHDADRPDTYKQMSWAAQTCDEITLVLAPPAAQQILDTLDLGIHRHKAGAMDPDEFTLH